MSEPTLAPNGIIGVLVPRGNTTTQLEIEPLRPPEVINAIARFNFGPGIDTEAELRGFALSGPQGPCGRPMHGTAPVTLGPGRNVSIAQSWVASS